LIFGAFEPGSCLNYENNSTYGDFKTGILPTFDMAGHIVGVGGGSATRGLPAVRVKST